MLSISDELSRFSKKTLIRLKKLQGTPYAIAAGFACGVAISFTPFVGFHLVLAALSAWIIRGNILSSAIGTLIGNPWTFPFIWIAVLSTGRFFLGIEDHTTFDFAYIFETAWLSIKDLDFHDFIRVLRPILFPMMIGCVPFYIASWIISYRIVKSTMDKLAKRRQQNKE
ncbi:MAG: DUF2062 domain-containing protein [Alphaproteobacteria bacterium]|nr:DUF2062 domain-containing protein [Alphaproteobacteria bacterium]